MTRQDYERWRFQTELVEEVLVQIERGVRDILKAAEWPTGIEAIAERLTTIPKKKRRRAAVALHALTAVRDVRLNLGPATPNAAMAAAAALRAGAIAANLGIELQAKAKNVKGGKKRGTAISAKARETDRLVKSHSKTWRISDELQDKYRSEAQYITLKTKRKLWTVQRSLRRLHPRQ